MLQPPNEPSPTDLGPVETRGLCLLSLDGGGVRGLSSLFILQALMTQLNNTRQESGLSAVKPCEVFDLIGGTSTGGLIAIMLGRLEMDVDECIAAYTKLAKDVFAEQKHRSKASLKGKLQARFDSEKLRTAIEEVITNRGLSPTAKFNDGQPRGCRVIVCAASKDTTKSIAIFRSFDTRRPILPIPATICEAALATSAATGFFDPVTIDDRQFVDGALGANNPVSYVEKEASDIWCPETGNLQGKVKCFISIGTGNLGTRPMEDSVFGFLSQTLVQITTDAECSAGLFISRWRQHYDQNRYFRFNVEQGLQTVGLAEYKSIGTIKAATGDYLNHQGRVFRVRDCIENLKQKQSREMSKSHQQLDAARALAFNEVNKEFIGRKNDMEVLEQVFFNTSNTIEKVAVYGLPGMGKTALALEYAHKWRERYHNIFFVSAAEPETFSTAYAKLYYLQVCDETTRWLMKKTHSENWLLIVDNVVNKTASTVSSLFHLASTEERRVGFGHILFTTASEEVSITSLTRDNSVSLSQLDREDAVELFMSVSGARLDDCKEIFDRLPRSPIAIIQIAKNVIFDKRRLSLLAGDLESPIGLATSLRRGSSLQAIFEKCVEKLEADPGDCKHLDFLMILCHLHTNVLDLTVLETLFQVVTPEPPPWQLRNPFKRKASKVWATIGHNIRKLQDTLPSPCSHNQLAADASLYARMSLLQRDGMKIVIPDMFQTFIYDYAKACRKEMDSPEKYFFILSLLLVFEIATAEPWLCEDRKFGLPFTEIVYSLMRYAHHADEEWEYSYVAEINFHAADYLCTQMWTEQACVHYDWAFEYYQKMNRTETPRDFIFVENFGLALYHEGDYQGAKRQFHEAYEGFKRLEGKHSSNTFGAKLKQIDVLQAQGRTKEAETVLRALRETYRDPRKAKKTGKRCVWEIKLTLAQVLREQGQYQAAMEQFEDVLRDVKREDTREAFGAGADTDLLSTLQNLSVAQMNLGNHEEADYRLRIIMKGKTTSSTLKEILGADFKVIEDEDTAKSKDSLQQIILSAKITLGASLIEQELYKEATDHFDWVLQQLETLGKPLSRTDRLLLTEGSALAHLFCGRLKKAQEEFKFLDDQYLEHRDPNWYSQPEIRAMEGLAFAKGLQGCATAREGFLRVISLSKKYIGETHPDLFTTYHRFGMVLELQGDRKGALTRYLQAFEGKKTTLGAHHLLTVQSAKAWSRVRDDDVVLKAEQ